MVKRAGVYPIESGNRWINLWIKGSGAALAIVLFPGYFIYHWGVFYGYWPAVFGGLFGPVLSIAPVLLLPALAVVLRSRGTSLVWVVTIQVLFGYSIVYTVLHHTLGTGLESTREAAEQALAAVMLMFALFLVGLTAPWSSARFGRVLGIGGLICLLLLGWSLVRDTGLGFGSPIHETASSYQGLARSLMFVFLVFVSISDSGIARTTGFALGAIGLFAMGARSEFVGFLFGSAALALAPRGFVLRRLAVLMFITMTVMLIINFAVQAEAGTGFARFAQLMDLSTSTSWQHRQYQTDEAWRQIAASPIFGSFGAHQAVGGTGDYAHNYLSAWVAFGLPGFLGYSVAVITTVVYSCRRVRRRDRSPVWRVSFSLGMACLLLVALSKSIFWSLPALVWGIVGAGLLSEQTERTRSE